MPEHTIDINDLIPPDSAFIRKIAEVGQAVMVDGQPMFSTDGLLWLERIANRLDEEDRMRHITDALAAAIGEELFGADIVRGCGSVHGGPCIVEVFTGKNDHEDPKG